MEVVVEFGVAGGRAIVYEADAKCWCLKIGTSEVRREFAPHMHNLQMDPCHRHEDIEDVYPFLVVRAKLEQLHAKFTLLDSLLGVMNTEFPTRLRKEFAATANSTANNAELIATVREILLTPPLPAHFDFPKEITSDLSPTLRVIIEEVRAKCRP